MADLRRIPVICGPTGSGKTGIAVSLAEKYPLEVISADSRQIIRHLDIGTAKPTAQECNIAPTHLVNIVEPGERYSAFRFIDDAVSAVSEITARKRLPVIVGGTGLYIRALMEGVVEMDDDDMEIRRRLENEMEEQGPGAMYERLEAIDPLEASKLHPNNKVRVIRALEIFHVTGKCKSELVVTGAYRKPAFEFEAFCLMPDREELYRVIDDRVERMMEMGLLEELRGLIQRGLGPGIRRARVIGYAELLDHLDGNKTLPEAVNLIKQNTRRYAKRQLTWFRNQVTCRQYPDRDSLRAELGEFLDGPPA